MYTAKDIRNICLLGHGGDGKSALAESMLFLTKAIDRLGKRTDGNTTSDFDPEEIKRGYSISTAVLPVEYNKCKLNILDNPGYFAFSGEVAQSLRVADAGLICLTAKGGIAVGTEKGWDAYETCSRCDHTTYAELPILGHDYQAVTVDPTCEADGYTIFTCSRCKDSYTADPTDQLGHQFGAWSPNGTGSQSADCLRDGCAHTGSTDCRKFTFRTAEGETLTFCPVCGQAENAAQLEKIDAATAWTISGSLSAADVTARTNGEYLSVAFETAGSLTQPTGRVRLALPAGLLEGKTLVRIAPDGTQTEMPFETERGKLIYTLDFANSALPVMLFRLVPQTAAL